jgi:hypothetical protein
VAISDDIEDYIEAVGVEPQLELQALSEDAPVLLLGEDHSALFRSLEILNNLVVNGQYRYFANEWLLNAGPIRKGLRPVWRGGSLPEQDPSNREERALATRYTPWVPALHGLRRQRIYHLAVGTRAQGEMRDRRIAMHYVEEAKDRGLSRRSSGIGLFGASHASAVPFFNKTRTTRQCLEAFGFKLRSVRIFDGSARQSGGFEANSERGLVAPLEGGASFFLPGLLPSGVNHLAVPTRRAHDGQRSPFFSVAEKASTSGRSIAQQFEVIVLARDP